MTITPILKVTKAITGSAAEHIHEEDQIRAMKEKNYPLRLPKSSPS